MVAQRPDIVQAQEVFTKYENTLKGIPGVISVKVDNACHGDPNQNALISIEAADAKTLGLLRGLLAPRIAGVRIGLWAQAGTGALNLEKKKPG